jgi:azurin
MPKRPAFWFILFATLFTYSAMAQMRRDTTIVLKAVTGLQFNQPRLVIKPNTRLRLVLQNTDDMAHNLVLTKPNSRLRVVEFALALGERGPKLDHVPPMPEVLAHTRTVDPGNSDTLTVTLDEGAYPYVCTYPGHGSIMYGVLYVIGNPKRLPPLETDPNVPNRSGSENHAHHSQKAPDHPYTVRLPAVHRTFMPDCSPAAIAVGLPAVGTGPEQSYCWDASTCRLRYAWAGGFVDNSEQWEGKGQRLTKIVGDIYYREQTEFPFQTAPGKPKPAVRFRGYRLINRYPEFQYTIGTILVRELIKPVKNGRGLVRTFTFDRLAEPLTFAVSSDAGIHYQTSLGPATKGAIRIPAGTQQFTVTMSTL